MALAAELDLPSWAPSSPLEERGTLWIAPDDPPFTAQEWPLLTPIPAGWHEVPAPTAAQFLGASQGGLSFLIEGPPADDLSAVAALLSSAPDPARRQDGRPPRQPRVPRQPRAPRSPRTVRPERLFREGRPPRPPRPPRKPRPPRPPRKPRAARPRYVNTRTHVGTCKGPACTCWTPAGCIGSTWKEAIALLYPKECLKGPCYSYEACVTEKCLLHVGCVINTILQFWARQYHAAVAYVEPVVVQVPVVLQKIVTVALSPAPAQPEVTGEPGFPPGAYRKGCPPGEYWTIGLTGCRCVPKVFNLPPATRAQVTACLGYDPGPDAIEG